LALQKQVFSKRDDLEEMKSKSKLELQGLFFEHEKLTRQQEYLADQTKTEQERKVTVQNEKNKKSMKATELKF
jgi:hypothetical protein